MQYICRKNWLMNIEQQNTMISIIELIMMLYLSQKKIKHFFINLKIWYFGKFRLST